MPGAKRLAAWLLWAALAAGQTCAPATAFATPDASVAVGSTGSRTGDASDAAALRTALRRELDALGSVRVAASERRAQYVLRGSVTRLDARDVGRETEVRCEVSLIVAEARGGSIRLLLSGRAGARGAGDARRLEAEALGAAVRGALRPLGATLVATR